MNRNSNVFVLRAKPSGIDREDQFLDGTISIGWGVGESLKGMSRDTIEQKLIAKYGNFKAVNVTQVCFFVSLPIGSIILTPSNKSRDIHIFKTTSEYIYTPENETEGNPHTIEVEYLETVARDVFSPIVNRALISAKKTISNFGKYSEEILEVVSGNPQSRITSNTTPIESDDETIKEAQQTLKELLKSENEEVRLRAALALLGKE